MLSWLPRQGADSHPRSAGESQSPWLFARGFCQVLKKSCQSATWKVIHNIVLISFAINICYIFINHSHFSYDKVVAQVPCSFLHRGVYLNDIWDLFVWFMYLVYTLTYRVYCKYFLIYLLLFSIVYAFIVHKGFHHYQVNLLLFLTNLRLWRSYLKIPPPPQFYRNIKLV